jgi:hypothetical protein
MVAFPSLLLVVGEVEDDDEVISSIIVSTNVEKLTNN